MASGRLITAIWRMDVYYTCNRLLRRRVLLYNSRFSAERVSGSVAGGVEWLATESEFGEEEKIAPPAIKAGKEFRGKSSIVSHSGERGGNWTIEIPKYNGAVAYVFKRTDIKMSCSTLHRTVYDWTVTTLNYVTGPEVYKHTRQMASDHVEGQQHWR